MSLDGLPGRPDYPFEAVAHAGEILMGRFEAASLIRLMNSNHDNHDRMHTGTGKTPQMPSLAAHSSAPVL
jgi:hypothetical protein